MARILDWLGLCRVRYTVEHTPKGGKKRKFTMVEIVSKYRQIQYFNHTSLAFRMEVMTKSVPFMTLDDKLKSYWKVLV
jgi:hypothetical protein